MNDGTAFMHRECLLRTVIGSEDCIRRGPHAPGACLPDDPQLTKRQAALAAYRAWLERNQTTVRHVDEPGTRMVRWNLPLDDSPCYGTLDTELMLDLLTQCTRFPVGYLAGKPVEWAQFIFFKEFVPLRRRMRLN
jgi:hypothetical protein